MIREEQAIAARIAEEWASIASAGIAYRDSKGSAPATIETCIARLASLAVEVGELCDALRGEGNLRHEIADVALYACTLLHDLGGLPASARVRYHGGPRARVSVCPDVAVAPLRRHVEQAIVAWQRGRERDVLIALELVLTALAHLRDNVIGLKGTLREDCLVKIDVMLSRPARHGKRADV